MKKHKDLTLSRRFDRFSTKVTKAAGSPFAFLCAFIIVLSWGMLGPVFKFSDTWQLVINTGTTIVTFLMVFIIQQSQNKDTMAIHLKLNELIASTQLASNRMIDIEDLTTEELEIVKNFYIHLSHLAEKEIGLKKTHTIDEARQNHSMKMDNRGRQEVRSRK